MLVQMLILTFGFALFTAFAQHCQTVRQGETTLKALAHHLDLALAEDLPWDQFKKEAWGTTREVSSRETSIRLLFTEEALRRYQTKRDPEPTAPARTTFRNSWAADCRVDRRGIGP
jgi:hypothetical protein